MYLVCTHVVQCPLKLLPERYGGTVAGAYLPDAHSSESKDIGITLLNFAVIDPEAESLTCLLNDSGPSILKTRANI